MAAMGVLAPGQLLDRAAIEQIAVNSGPNMGSQDGWGSEEQLTNTGDTNNLYWGTSHKVVVASNGVRHVVWQTNTHSIYYKRYYPGVGWTDAKLLDTDSYEPSIALDASNNIHVVWHSNKHINKCFWHVFYWKCVPGTSGTGGWVGTPLDICTSHAALVHWEAAVACAPNRVVVAWYEYGNGPKNTTLYSISFRECVSGAWQTQVQVGGASTYPKYYPSISAAGNGDVFVSSLGTGASQPSRHVYVARRINSVWGAWEDVTPGSAGIHYVIPDIDVDPVTGYPHVVCHSYDTVTVHGYSQYHICHTYRTTSGWQPLELISNDTNRVDCQPSMFFAGDGSAYVVWNDETGVDRGIMYRVRSPSGTWGTPGYIANYPGNPGYYDMCPNVTVSSTGDGYAVWMDGRNGPYQIWGKPFTPGGFLASEPGLLPDMAAMGVQAPVPTPDRALAEQTAVNSGPNIGWQDGWGSVAQITNNRLENVTYYGNVHKAVYSKDGVGHLVWYDQVGEAVYYKRFTPGSGWSKELQLAKTANYPCPAIALDSNGTTIHVVWRMWKHVGTTNYHIYYWKCNPNGAGTGGWAGTAMDLDENTAGRDHSFPSIAFGPNGQVVVAWQELWGTYPNWIYSIGFREYAGGAWQPQALIGDQSSYYRYYPSIAAAGNGNLFVTSNGPLADQANPRVLVASRIGTGSWSSWEDVTAGLPDLYFVIPGIEVNPVTKNPHIACHDYEIAVNGVDTTRYYHIYHSYRSGGVWTNPEVVSPATEDAEYQASMFFDAGGAAHVVWNGTDAGHTKRGIKYATCSSEGGAWTTPVWLTSNVSGISDHVPNITVQADGSLHAVWTRKNTTARYPYQIWGCDLPAGGFGAQAAGTTVTPHGFALDVSPNPVSRRMVVNYSLPAAGNVTLKLYDVRGAVAKTVACGSVLPGNHAVSLDRQGLARGAYILKLESGLSSLTRKLIIE